VGERGKALESGLAVCVEANVFPVLCRAAVTVVRDRGSGEVESAAIGGGDNFYGVWIMDIGGGAGDLEGGDLDVLLGEGAKQGGEVLGFEKGFVALNVDVDLGVDDLGDGVDAVGAAGEVRRGELAAPVIVAAEGGDLFGVGSDD